MKWTPDFAYAIGLIVTDGCLSNDGRHIDFTSAERDLVVLFKKCLSLHNKIGRKFSGYTGKNSGYRVQFGDVNYYNFLLSIGLMPAKTKKLETLKIPDKNFADFFRGCIDGDGNISIQNHPESQNPQLRVRLSSASPAFLIWIHKEIKRLVSAEGGWVESSKKQRVSVLTFGKADSTKILNFMYYPNVSSFLPRKFEKAKPFLRMWPNWQRRTV